MRKQIEVIAGNYAIRFLPPGIFDHLLMPEERQMINAPLRIGIGVAVRSEMLRSVHLNRGLP
jgi:hypothetical protein